MRSWGYTWDVCSINLRVVKFGCWIGLKYVLCARKYLVDVGVDMCGWYIPIYIDPSSHGIGEDWGGRGGVFKIGIGVEKSEILSASFYLFIIYFWVDSACWQWYDFEGGLDYRDICIILIAP